MTSDLTDLLAKANKLAGNICVSDGSSTYSVARQTKDDGSDVTFVAVLAIMMLGGSVAIMTRRRHIAGDC